jgi:hypothetical protein
MPVVELDAKRSVEELIGVSIKNNKLPGYKFQVVYEAVKLKID